MRPELLIEKIFALYEQHGHDDYIGEPVSQLEHMAQAAQLAEREGFDEEVILAAFFHDLGHLCAAADAAQMDGYGVVAHEKVGADFLRAHGFSERLARLVEAHVQAKRYLTYKHPDYYAQLSEASRQTLRFQGGRMSAEEAERFEWDPLFGISLRMRQWDEQAKEEDVPVPDLNTYKKMAQRHLKRQGFLFSGKPL